MSDDGRYLDDRGKLDVELLERLHRTNRYCLYPLASGKNTPDLDGDQAELVTALLMLARFAVVVRRVAQANPRRSAEATIRETDLRLSGAMRPRLKPGRLGED